MLHSYLGTARMGNLYRSCLKVSQRPPKFAFLFPSPTWPSHYFPKDYTVRLKTLMKACLETAAPKPRLRCHYQCSLTHAIEGMNLLVLQGHCPFDCLQRFSRSLQSPDLAFCLVTVPRIKRLSSWLRAGDTKSQVSGYLSGNELV